ncbi:MAG: discoidin domain-containing protein, partial [Planctomycetes bacterium]|nr:discoidin domain-containing protein [Planctomycetota bacterium]
VPLPPVPWLLATPNPVHVLDTLRLEFGGRDDGEVMLYKLDADGNGTWDAEFTASGVHTWSPSCAGRFNPRLRVVDDDGLEAEVAPPVDVLDAILPDPVAILSLTDAPLPPPLGPLSAGEFSSQHPLAPAANAVDGNYASFWSSEMVGETRAEQLVVDLPYRTVVGAVRLSPRAGFGSLLPGDFELAYEAGGAWVGVVPRGAATGLSRKFDPVTTARLRVRFPHNVPVSGLREVQLAEVDVFPADPRGYPVLLAVVVPSDNLGRCRVQAIEVRFSTSPITEATWVAATWAGTWLPDPTGATMRLEVHGLTPGTTYYLAASAWDHGGNRGPLRTAGPFTPAQ